MSKRLILLLVVVYFFSYFNLVWANVVISEVKISPIEDRFIKLYNQDDVVVDLTNWYIQRKTQTGSSFGSLISKTNFENKSIGAKSYFLISRSSTENSDIIFDGLTLTESNAIQIKNGNGEVIDKVCWGDINECDGNNLPNPVSGQSIQVVNQNVSTQEVLLNSTISTSDNSSNQTTTEIKTKVVEELKIKTKITAKTFGFVGLSLSLEAMTLGYGGEPLHNGRYFWNFGDADSREIKLSDYQPFTHTYFYPGEYTISLDYFQNYYSSIPDASDKIVIKIVPADIVISRVGDEKDFFVEIFNNTDYDVDISNWVLIGREKSFTMPQNTILTSKKKMIISPKITNFSITDRNTLKLTTPQGEIVFKYTKIQPPVSPLSRGLSVSSGGGKQILPPDKGESKGVSEIYSNISLASAISSDILPDNQNNFYPAIIFVIFVSFSALAVYFIRRKRMAFQSGDDFEILDE